MSRVSPERIRRGPPGNGGEAHAFTLLELLTVVAIVAVLAAVAVPVYGVIRARADAAACRSNLGQIGIALNLYLGEHDMRFPDLEAGRRSLEDEVPTIDRALAEYAGNPDVFRCPSDDGGFFETTGSSYYWNSLLNGQRAGSLDFFGRRRGAAGIPVVTDKEDFHESVGSGVNVLYADGAVASEVRFSVGSK